MQLEISFLQEICPKELGKRETVVTAERIAFFTTCYQDDVVRIVSPWTHVSSNSAIITSRT